MAPPPPFSWSHYKIYTAPPPPHPGSAPGLIRGRGPLLKKGGSIAEKGGGSIVEKGGSGPPRPPPPPLDTPMQNMDFLKCLLML